MKMTLPIIKTDCLSFDIKGKKILEQIDFSVSTGRKVFIVGANGAGKTTLLKCLAGIINDFSGQIQIEGRNRKKYHSKKLAKILTYLPQSQYGDIFFTVRQFVTMARYPHLSPFTVISKADREIVDNALALTDTEKFSDRVLATLSGGEAQQVTIAAAVAQQAKIFLLDEPATYLDYKHQQLIYSLLEKINSQNGTTIVCVTHDLNSAVLNADRIVALKQGRIIFSGSGTEIMNPEVLENIYDKKFSFAVHPQTNQKIIVPDKAE